MDIKEKLNKMGITLPPPPSPAGSYIPAIKTGNLIFLSGVLPFQDGNLPITGRVDRDVTIEEASKLARLVVLNALSILDAEFGLQKISRCIRINGFVASSEGFYKQPQVLNGASDFLKVVFGEAGRHTRTAIGAFSLPLNSPVEIDFVFEAV